MRSTTEGPLRKRARNEPRWWRHVLQWFRVWWPAIICVMVIMRESTPHFRSEYTSILLRPLFTWLCGPISDDVWYGVHFYIRKAGHFTGYGITALAFMRGWRWHWHYFYFRQALKRRAALMALCCTAVLASADELHQSYLRSRTGEIKDVLLDTLGAATMLGISLLWSRSRYRRAELIEQLDAGKPE